MALTYLAARASRCYNRNRKPLGRESKNIHDDGSKPEANNSKPKSLMRRYDRRAFNGRYPSTNKRGPKPLYLKTKSLNSSLRSLASFEKIATDEDIYKKAWDAGDACPKPVVRNHSAATVSYSFLGIAPGPFRAFSSPQKHVFLRRIRLLIPRYNAGL